LGAYLDRGASDGVRVDLGPRFYARPDARLMMIMGSGRNQTFGLFTMNVGWRF